MDLAELIDPSRRSRRSVLTMTVIPYAIGMVAANLIGAVIVFVAVVWLVPMPVIGDTSKIQVVNAIVLGAYLAVAIPVGAAWAIRKLRPVTSWLMTDRDPTPEEQVRSLRMPMIQLRIHATLWMIGAGIFIGLNLAYEPKLGMVVAIAAMLGLLATCALGYLIAERLTRGVARVALASGVLKQPAVPSVTTRILLAWAMSTGVPVLGLALIGGGSLIGVLPHEQQTLELSALILSVIALAVGLLAMVLITRAVADPVTSVRKAIDRVREGDFNAEVPVYDGSEIGLLQAGFNDMVAGLREREHMRDIFGRHVGEDVAEQALEQGVSLGGELRDVAVMFVDLVGSTELAVALPPQEVVRLLNLFFGVVVEVVGRHGGSINKFEGDAALCVFGAPSTREDAAGDALAAARELVVELRRTLPQLDLGVGVSAGDAVAGNIGSAERFEYTVIGDPVNEAARLTELAKKLPERLLASGAAVDRSAPGEAARWTLGEEVLLRGRDRPTVTATPVQVKA
ncbi:MAG: adenylate/guanylate cyclase domain-containing protein [Actinobacteria bacterium]|nr:adenylate/guanylate cyclase domain-containing protein [Actinomycetota bacterium]